MIRNILLIVFLYVSFSTFSQTLSGIVSENGSKEILYSATVMLKDATGNKMYSVTDSKGFYNFKKLPSGKYTLSVSYLGYKDYNTVVTIAENDNKRMDIAMDLDTHMLESVTVEARVTRAVQHGDSLIYNAEAFKVLQGSTAEELLAKMPGIVVEGGSVQAQGEAVKKVLVDGKEFFDGDVNMALKNLPADIIANIEVFDKKSEQAEFTGFDDGEEIKTINIVTKAGYKEGIFGDVYGGYGTDNRYRAGGNVNIFNEDRRISLLGMSNNINQQNFSQEDLAGVMASSSEKGRGGKRVRGGEGRNAGGNTNNFMVGSLGGVTTTNGLGVNYVDQWSEKIKFTGSCFFNQSTNLSEKETDRNYFDPEMSDLIYEEYNESKMTNWNHRINMKLDYQPDSRNSFQIRPSISFQKNDKNGLLQGSSISSNILDSEVENVSHSQVDAYNFGGNMIWRHRFPTVGRTISATFGGTLSNKTGNAHYEYMTRSYGESTIENSYGQITNSDEKKYSFNGRLMFTENLIETLQLQLNYRTSYSNDNSDRKVYEQPLPEDLREQLVENLSNEYESGYWTHSGGLGLRFRKNKINVMLNGDFQYSSLNGERYYPQKGQITKKFFSILPSLTARYSADRSNSFIFRYRSRSVAPSINELQDVIDNTNPLFLTSGNPNLNQQISHTLNLRYVRTTQSGHTIIAMAGATFQTDYVADSTFVSSEDMTLPSGINMDKGAQFTKPVNMDGYYSFQSMLTYGFPLDFIRSNVNINFAANYANVPTIFNGNASSTRELSMIPKIIIGSNISHNLDFTLSYSANINKMFNSSLKSNGSDYVNQSASVKLGWTFWKGITLKSSLIYTNYSGLSSDDSDYCMWNASVGKKFLSHNQAEIRLEAYDILKQNTAFAHKIGSNYYDYIRSNVIKPYMMLTFAYTLR